ncbi:YqaA family protein [Herpetosiphon giganteus]|uniref:YqaA family protein n=1 Tax=Herpetosiphon giganteus TaxID=2029754 RepID=UPI00195CD4C5|nr:YqaA family protein [Herpetosiphon giganteus]MBM7845744.1 membrane protein YqaA with SNARE-associated domain [Herpetosiphon giganteus]
MIWLYLSLFGVSFLAATVLPLGSEAALAAMVVHAESLWLPLLVATLGNVLGSATTFWLGQRARTVIDQRNHKMAERMQRAERWLGRWGTPALILAWLPIIGDVLVAVAGALELPWVPSLAWITLGKALRYGVIGAAVLAV